MSVWRSPLLYLGIALILIAAAALAAPLYIDWNSYRADIEDYGRQLTGRVDNSSYPSIDVNIDFTLVLPEDAAGPVPVMIMFRGGSLAQAVGNEPPRRGGGGQGGVSDGVPARGAGL